MILLVIFYTERCSLPQTVIIWSTVLPFSCSRQMRHCWPAACRTTASMHLCIDSTCEFARTIRQCACKSEVRTEDIDMCDMCMLALHQHLHGHPACCSTYLQNSLQNNCDYDQLWSFLCSLTTLQHAIRAAGLLCRWSPCS